MVTLPLMAEFEDWAKSTAQTKRGANARNFRGPNSPEAQLGASKQHSHNLDRLAGFS
jgi:hypothetical protein